MRLFDENPLFLFYGLSLILILYINYKHYNFVYSGLTTVLIIQIK